MRVEPLRTSRWYRGWGSSGWGEESVEVGTVVRADARPEAVAVVVSVVVAVPAVVAVAVAVALTVAVALEEAEELAAV